MADFKKAFDRTAINEGGYTNNPSDRGNWIGKVLIGTNKGVSAPVLKDFLGRTPTVQEMKNLSTDTVRSIFKKNYWDVMQGDKWDDQVKAEHVYDMCINAGCGAAIKLWQLAIGAPATGKMNKITIDKTNIV